MNCRRRLASLRAWLLLLVLAVASNPRAAGAAEPLVWTFESGGTIRYRVTRTVDVTYDLGPGGKESRSYQLRLDLVWTIEETTDDGGAKLTQSINDLGFTLSGADGEAVVFEASSGDEARGFAATIAPLLRELLRAEVSFVMDDRGSVSEVDVPDSLAKALTSSPGASVLGELAAEQGLELLLKQTTFVTPETLDADAQWSATTEAVVPDAGQIVKTTTYSYEGTREIAGAQLEAFAVATSIDFAGGPVEIGVERQESTGDILFNRTAGQMESKSVEHAVEITVTQDGHPIRQTLRQSFKVRPLSDDAI